MLEHVQKILSSLDILDKNNMKRRYLVVDNSPIHTNQSITRLVEQRGYEELILPFLNPIEKFWLNVKLSMISGQHYFY